MQPVADMRGVGVKNRGKSTYVLCNHFLSKKTLFMILLQFRTILFLYKLCVTVKRTNANKLKFSYLLTVSLSIPFIK